MNGDAQPRRFARRDRRPGRGFTLIELLVVVALIGALATVWLTAGADHGSSSALRSAEATLANLIVATRTRAVATGRSARLLIHSDPASPQARERYLRYLVLQSHDGSAWRSVAHAVLPAGAYVMPREPSAVSGLLEGVAWTRASDGKELRSSALRSAAVSADAEVDAAIDGATVERWCGVVFSAHGTTVCTGDLVIAHGRVQPGIPPVQLVAPDRVCGVALSTYGLVTRIPDWASF